MIIPYKQSLILGNKIPESMITLGPSFVSELRVDPHMFDGSNYININHS